MPEGSRGAAPAGSRTFDAYASNDGADRSAALIAALPSAPPAPASLCGRWASPDGGDAQAPSSGHIPPVLSQCVASCLGSATGSPGHDTSDRKPDDGSRVRDTAREERSSPGRRRGAKQKGGRGGQGGGGCGGER